MGKEAVHALRRAIQNHRYVFIARFPHVCEEYCSSLLVERQRRVAEPIERIAQWRAPFLVPPIASSGIAAAVLAPACDAVRATPGTVLDDLRFMLRWMFLQVLAVVRELGDSLFFDVLERISKGHVSVCVMMSVTFAIGGDMHQLWPVAGVGKASGQAMRELLAAVEQLLECHCLRNGCVVEKYGDAAPVAQAHDVRTTGIDLRSTRITVGAGANPAETPSLIRRQNRKFDPKLGH